MNNEPKKRTLSLVIPNCKKSEEIEILVKKANEALSEHYNNEYELILVCHADETAKVANQLTKEIPTLKVIQDGHEKPLECGWGQACGDILATIDGLPEEVTPVLKEISEALNNGSQLTVCSRYNQSLPGSHSITSCFAVEKDSIGNLESSSKGYKLILEMLGPDMIKELTNTKKSNSVWTELLSWAGWQSDQAA